MANRNQIVIENIFDPNGNPAFLVDASDLEKPKPLAEPGMHGFFFFGADAPQMVPELSKQWLTEVVVGVNRPDAASALADATEHRMRQEPNQPRLKLSLDYNCTECGKDTRIIRVGLEDLNDTWSYVVVDAEDGPNQTVIAHEIWFSKTTTLTPTLVDGRPLARPQAGGKPIDGARIAQRIRDAHSEGESLAHAKYA
jgi:hypothetical protein